MDVMTMWMAHYPEVVRRVRRYAASHAEAEDIAQTAFVRALEHVDELETMNEGHALAWLLRTAYNAAIDMIRRRSRETQGIEGFEAGYTEDYSDIHVSQLLGRLPGQLAEIVRLRYIDGYTSTAVGERLGLPPATVRTRLRAAMRLLRQYEQETGT